MYCLLLQLEPWGVKGASHQVAVMRTAEPLVTRFTVLSTQWMNEGNEDVGSI